MFILPHGCPRRVVVACWDCAETWCPVAWPTSCSTHGWKRSPRMSPLVCWRRPPGSSRSQIWEPGTGDIKGLHRIKTFKAYVDIAFSLLPSLILLVHKNSLHLKRLTDIKRPLATIDFVNVFVLMIKPVTTFSAVCIDWRWHVFHCFSCVYRLALACVSLFQLRV